MTEQQKQALKEKICAELERLTGDIAHLEEATKPQSAEDMDEITRMDAVMTKSFHDAALVAAKARLAGLEYALKRIDDPDFGFCMDCGEEIPLPRLMAMPESALCVDCAK